MGKHRRKTKTKYIVRRVVFALLLLLVVVLGGWKLWQLFGGEDPVSGIHGEPASLPESSEPPVSAPDPAPDPEPEPQPEPDPGPDIDPQDWRLVLINPTHAIEKELEMEFDEVQGYQFDKRITGKIRELIAAAKEDGINLAIISGYRTMDRSRILYANKIAEYKNMGYDEATAKIEAAKWVAPPGTSEHHSGLAMDIVSAGYYTKYSDLVEAFENDPEAIWLKENCARFGFILRFPKDKTEVTGINFEPWHFRYVGEEHAKEIMEQGICLEEYLGETE
ncbi:MAG: M15 family metallopeptidase [Angelakisella sp.]|jgi:D-alanyl-D-alanine carboxypeptidase|nr:M15 family metallopeptidase [Angelakisella sp.]